MNGKKIFINPTSDRGLISKIKELKKLGIKIPNNPILKMGHRTKQRILNRRNSNGPKTLKEMSKTFSHQGNANQNNYQSEWLKSKPPMIAYAGENVE